MEQNSSQTWKPFSSSNSVYITSSYNVMSYNWTSMQAKQHTYPLNGRVDAVGSGSTIPQFSTVGLKEL